jgi:effector-binding domain-containing protein
MITEPKLEDRGEQPYVAIRSRVRMDELGKVLPPLWGDVFAWLRSRGIEPAGAPFWNYRRFEKGAILEVDVAVPVATAVPGDERVIADVIPAGRYATRLYTGPFEGDGLMLATADLLAWADKNGIVWDRRQSSPTIEDWKARLEIYLTDPAEEPDPQKYVTELAFRLADDQSH